MSSFSATGSRRAIASSPRSDSSPGSTANRLRRTAPSNSLLLGENGVDLGRGRQRGLRAEARGGQGPRHARALESLLRLSFLEERDEGKRRERVAGARTVYDFDLGR